MEERFPDRIPEDARDVLREYSSTWREYCGDAETFSVALERLPLDEAVLSEVLSDALAYVHETGYQARIYQEALYRLEQGQSEDEVDEWLKGLDYPVKHNLLRPALLRRIGQAAQSAIVFIKGFIAQIVNTLNMPLQSWEVSFSASPGITVTFG
jgi:hypothetical protein